MESASVRNIHTPLSLFGFTCIDESITGSKIVDNPILDSAHFVCVSPE